MPSPLTVDSLGGGNSRRDSVQTSMATKLTAVVDDVQTSYLSGRADVVNQMAYRC
jgi:hypothetical protein